MDFSIFDTFVEDILGEKSARPIIIIGASKIDDLLYRILEKYFLSKNSKNNENDELLEGDNPLGTFSSRIKTVNRLGIIDKSLYNILERIRKIRNKSAHSIEFNINKAPIKDHLLELKKLVLKRDSFKLTNERYFKDINLDPTKEIQCILLTVCVLLESINEKIDKTNGIPETLKISRR